ncbi:MAG: DUF5305 domain-containing protein [Oscillospiraceae bacterium]|nr:DUF5305 domain-containing protein [Oscillospiraceae bacterium]
MFSAQGKNNVSYEVVYLENHIFDDSVRPQGTHDLLSYTDYIEVKNSFSADFSERAALSYSYTAKERFFIKHQQSADNNTNPVVYEKELILSNLSGNIDSVDSVSWNGENPEEPGGVYIINFDEHIRIYRDFIGAHEEMLETRDFSLERNVRFTAEILVDFTYKIESNGMMEIITRGVTFPISLEVFLPEFSGVQDFDVLVEVGEKTESPTTIALFVLIYAVSIFGICLGLKKLVSRKNDKQYEVDMLLKKYSDEIVKSEIRPDLSEYKVILVTEFRELLKTILSENNNIIYYGGQDKAYFYVLSDKLAYTYCIDII